MPDPLLQDLDLPTVKARTLSGVVTLISRSFILQLVATGGFFLLTLFLDRPEVGLFIAVNDLVSVLGYFSDIGLAASLIQKKDRLTVEDLRTTFTIQQLLVVSLIGITLLLSPALGSYYHISGSGMGLLYALLAAFFLASLKTIPSVILERQLHFKILASVEVVETLVFYCVAVLLAWQGRGVESYAWAVVLRGIVGTALVYLLSPWKIGFALSRSSLAQLLSFGLPYQINSLMAVVKDRFLNIALWRIIGADGVGVIGWAQTWSQKPLRFVMDNVTKVTFPSFSRLQDHPQQLRAGIEKSLFFISLITFPTVAGIALSAPLAINLLPQYGKWQAAVAPLTLYCFSAALAAVSTPLTNVLNAVGKVKVNTYLMIMWTVLTWVLTPTLAVRYGYMGVAYASALIALSSFVPVIIVRRLTGFSFWAAAGRPAVAALVMSAVFLSLARIMPVSLSGLVINVGLSAAVFGGVIYLLVGPSLLADMKGFWYGLTRRA